MGSSVQTFVAGLVTIGIITALFQSGRSTAAGINAVGSAGSALLGSAISGSNKSK